MRTSTRLKIPYWVNPAEVEDYSAKKWRELDKSAEIKYVHQLNVGCEMEQQKQVRMMQDAQGWLFQDEEKMVEARKLDMKNCKRLRELGYVVQ